MPIEWAVKDNYAPKEMGSNKQRKGGGEIRRRVPILRLKKNKIYGIIKTTKACFGAGGEMHVSYERYG